MHRPDTGTPMAAPRLATSVELTIIGTGHVFAIGEHVARLVHERNPDVVAVELDPVRLQGLRQRKHLAELHRTDPVAAAAMETKLRQAAKRLPLVYRWLAGLQDRIADEQGVDTGNEMLAAAEAAEARGVPIACIDVEAQALLARAWKAMKIGERARFLFSLAFQGRTRRGGSTVDEELEEYQNDPLAYLAKFGDRFPNLKRVLIDDRDEHMAARIAELGQAEAPDRIRGARQPMQDRVAGERTGLPQEGPLRVVAVVGDGHVEGMLAWLDKKGIQDPAREVIRVQTLRAGILPGNPFPERAPSVAPPDHSSVGFGFDVTLE